MKNKFMKALLGASMVAGLIGVGAVAPANAATITSYHSLSTNDGGAKVDYEITWNSDTRHAEVWIHLDDTKADGNSPKLSVRFYQNQDNQEYNHITHTYGASGGIWNEYFYKTYYPMTLIDIKICNGEFNNSTCGFHRANNPYLY